MAVEDEVADTPRTSSRTRRGPVPLYVAEILSGGGDGIFWVALVALFADRAHFGLVLGLAVLARLGPRALLSLPAGPIVSGSNLRSLLITIELIRSILMLGLGIVLVVDDGLSSGVVLGVMLVSYIIGVPTRPGLAVALPRICSETELAPANATLSALRQVMTFVGPLAGVAIAAWSPAAGVAINGATFAGSALLIAITRGLHDPSPFEGAPAAPRRYTRPDRHLATLRATPALPQLISLTAAMYFVRGAEMVVHVLVVRDLLRADPTTIGYLAGAVGLGALAAMPISARAADAARPVRPLVVAALLTALPTAALALATRTVEAVALLVPVGVGMVMFEVITVVTIQRTVAPAALGRTFGALHSAGNAGKLAGAIGAPLMVAAVGTSGTLVLISVLLSIVVVASVRSIAGVGRAASDRRRELRPVVDALDGLSLFDGLPRFALERIATVVRHEAVEPGTRLITEGDEPDDLFIARSGTFDVTVEGRPINQMEAGAWFGEIGLVDRVPRTATVTATTPATVWRIPGRVFLETLEEAGAAPDALVEGIAVRLATGRA